MAYYIGQRLRALQNHPDEQFFKGEEVIVALLKNDNEIYIVETQTSKGFSPNESAEKLKNYERRARGYFAHIIDWQSNNIRYSGGFEEIDSCNQPSNKTESKTNMSLTEKFVQAITGEPNKTFRKAGIINGDNILTQEGLLVLGTWLLNKNAKEFKEEIADGIVEEDEKKKCC